MIEEASIMAQLDHENLLKLIGICITEDIKIVTPLRPLGSLQKFLRAKKQFLGPREIISYCYQISSVCCY
jgi:serine/threonine protein kinase